MREEMRLMSLHRNVMTLSLLYPFSMMLKIFSLLVMMGAADSLGAFGVLGRMLRSFELGIFF